MTDSKQSKLLRVENIVKSYHNGEQELKVLQGTSFDVNRGEAVAIVGMSGSGKSTLLHLLGGLDIPAQGRIFFENNEITTKKLGGLDDFRNRSIGYVFQFHHLLPEFSALENVIIPAMIAGKKKHAVVPKASQLLDFLGLGERLHHRPSKLSGGEQQRVALARALMNDPALLLADEPTGNLDVHTGEMVIELMWSMTVKKDRGLVIVTHEPTIAARADKVLMLYEGKLESISRDRLAEIAAARKS